VTGHADRSTARVTTDAGPDAVEPGRTPIHELYERPAPVIRNLTALTSVTSASEPTPPGWRTWSKPALPSASAAPASTSWSNCR